MKKHIDVVKEKRDLKTLEIIRNVLLFIAFFLGVLIFCLETYAAPSGNSGSHHNSTSSNDAKLLNYVCDSGAESGQLLYGLGDNVFNDVADAYTTFMYFFVPESMLTTSEKEILGYFDDINAGSVNPSIIFDIDDSFNWTIKDEYKADYDSLIDKLIKGINNKYLLYSCIPTSNINSYVTVDNSSAQVNAYLAEFPSDRQPFYFTRWNDTLAFCSLVNVRNDNIDIDGLVLSTGSWEWFSTYFDTFQNQGYLNADGSHTAVYFDCYSNNNRYTNLSDFYWSGADNELANPFEVRAWQYDETSWNNSTRVKSAIFSDESDYMIFFADSSAYLSFYQNKSSIPMNFVNMGLDIPENFDYTQFFKSLDRNLINTTHNLEELYSYLQTELSKQIQDIIDSQRTTNELLLSLLRYYDKNIVKEGENITQILLDINESIKNISNPDEEEISSYLDTIIQDESIENRLKHIFPFGIFQDSKDLLDKFREVGVLEPRWNFRLNVGLFEEKYIDFTLDLTTVPEINTFKSFWFFFILLAFNIMCLCIEYKFLCMFMGGGD